MKTAKIIIFLILFFFFIVCSINVYIYIKSRNSTEMAVQKEFAIVLGASVHGEELSNALKARMQMAIALHDQKLVKNILMSGDGTDNYYSETVAMKKFALKRGIPQETLFTDEKGYSTYATMLRAKEVFNAKSAYVISQNFHLVRAVWIAREVGIDADGVGVGTIKDDWYYYVREFFARIKDYFLVEFNTSV